MKINYRVICIILVAYIIIFTIMLLMVLPLSVRYMEDKLLSLGEEELVLLAIFLAMGLFVGIVSMLMVYRRIRGSENYSIHNVDTRYGQIGKERSFLEGQIYEMNDKLMAADDRWKDMYHLVMAPKRRYDGVGKISIRYFLENYGIDFDKIEIQRDLVFILTPFHDSFSIVYNYVYKTCRSMRLTPKRGDEEYVEKDIFKHIIEQIVRARFVIAILDGRNPNVFYELGIVHAMNKPSILVARRSTEVPFDLQNQYIVLYDKEDELEEKLHDCILKMLMAI